MSNEVVKLTKYISIKASSELIEYVEAAGYCVELVDECPSVPAPIAHHPDIVMCRLGAFDNSPVFFGDACKLGPTYPQDVPYNAACTGKYFIHNVNYTDPALLEYTRSLGMIIVNVKQGYAKCSCVVVDQNSIITYDEGIAAACSKAGLSVLLVSRGNIVLEGYNTGFIGGCSGRIGDTIIFNGDLSRHPDHLDIVAFIQDRGLECKWFESWELTDIGSII